MSHPRGRTPSVPRRADTGRRGRFARSIPLSTLAGLFLVGLLAFFPRNAFGQEDTSRQITIFGIVATPDSQELDPKLRGIGPQLRAMFPNHGFRLVGVETKRISPGQTHTCNLGGGFTTQTQIINPLDSNGKVQLRFQLEQNGQLALATVVTTPMNQLSFAEKALGDGSRLVIGLGVRP